MARLTRNLMIENAEGLRVAAQQRRNRGWHTGARAKGHDWQRPRLDPADYQSHVIVALDEFRAAAREAVNTFQAECLNQPGECYDEIPF